MIQVLPDLFQEALTPNVPTSIKLLKRKKKKTPSIYQSIPLKYSKSVRIYLKKKKANSITYEIKYLTYLNSTSVGKSKPLMNLCKPAHRIF